MRCSVRKMSAARIDSPPTVPFFVLFFTLGGWVLVLLTAWLWEWSGLASLGMIYLLLVAPVLTGVMPWKLRSQRTLSTRAPTLKGFVSPAPMERIISPEGPIGNPGSILLTLKLWRRDRDSNPGYPCEYAAFPRRYIQPLCHLSGLSALYHKCHPQSCRSADPRPIQVASSRSGCHRLRPAGTPR